MQQVGNLTEYNGEKGPGESFSYGDNTTTNPPYQFNVVPFQVENCLDFIDIHEDGTALLGSSNITGKYWNGSIWAFKDVNFAPLKEKSLTGFGFEFGVTCGKFIGSPQTVVIGDEGGGVSTLKFQDLSNAVQCMPLETCYCHDQAVTSLSVTRDSLQTVSSSTDSSIIIWENQNLNRVKKYSPAHSREVTCVSVSKFHTDLIFASTSLDGAALLWDSRESKPAYSLIDNDSEPLSTLDWRCEKEIVFGSNNGSIHLFDIRNHKTISSHNLFNVPVIQISFNKFGVLAVAGLWNDIIVWDFDSNNAIYKDSRHSSTIRNICWHPSNHLLYSCGDKKTVLKHEIDLSAYSS